MALPKLFLNDDGRMIEDIRQGEEAPLHRLYRACLPMVRRHILSNNGTIDDAADMLQEALVILWERIRDGRYVHESKLTTFLMGTVKNLWLRRLARKRREPVGVPDLEFLPDGEQGTLETMVDEEEASSVGRALERLGDPCKTLLILFYWDELSMEEIAARMGFANADTAKAKKYQCKKSLRTMLLKTIGTDG